MRQQLTTDEQRCLPAIATKHQLETNLIEIGGTKGPKENITLEQEVRKHMIARESLGVYNFKMN